MNSQLHVEKYQVYENMEWQEEKEESKFISLTMNLS
jgi:hypothetical protein